MKNLNSIICTFLLSFGFMQFSIDANAQGISSYKDLIIFEINGQTLTLNDETGQTIFEMYPRKDNLKYQAQQCFNWIKEGKECPPSTKVKLDALLQGAPIYASVLFQILIVKFDGKVYRLDEEVSLDSNFEMGMRNCAGEHAEKGQPVFSTDFSSCSKFQLRSRYDFISRLEQSKKQAIDKANAILEKKRVAEENRVAKEKSATERNLSYTRTDVTSIWERCETDPISCFDFDLRIPSESNDYISILGRVLSLDEFKAAFHNKVYIMPFNSESAWLKFSLDFDKKIATYLRHDGRMGETEFYIVNDIKYCVEPISNGCKKTIDTYGIFKKQKSKGAQRLFNFTNVLGYHRSTFSNKNGVDIPSLDSYFHCGDLEAGWANEVRLNNWNNDEVRYMTANDIQFIKWSETGLGNCPQKQYLEFTGNSNENNAYFESEEVQFFVSEIKRKKEIENREGTIRNIGGFYQIYRHWEELCDTNSFFSNSFVDELKDLTAEIIKYSLVVFPESERDMMKDAGWDLSEKLLAKPNTTLDLQKRLFSSLSKADIKKACDPKTPAVKEFLQMQRMSAKMMKEMFSKKKSKEKKSRNF